MKRRIRSTALVLLLGFAVAQLIQPNTQNPPIDVKRSLWSDQRVDPRVAGIMRRACANCHSNGTKWPWYARISPVSWWLASHVSNGRAKLNLDDWTAASAAQADKLEEIYDSIVKSKMPMASYLLMHPEARLSPAERDILLAWADGKLPQSSR